MHVYIIFRILQFHSLTRQRKKRTQTPLVKFLEILCLFVQVVILRLDLRLNLINVAEEPFLTNLKMYIYFLAYNINSRFRVCRFLLSVNIGCQSDFDLCTYKNEFY